MMRHKGILLIVFTMFVAGAGIAYAHWTATLHIDGTVQTGGVHLSWQNAWTNDDGQDNGEGEPFASPAYDAWGPESSADPANPNGSERYDKDVAACWAWAEEGGDGLWFQIQNGFPSYHCMVSAVAVNMGSVPVKATAIDIGVGYNHCDYFLAGGEPVPQGGDEGGEFADWNLNEWYDGFPDEQRIYHDDAAGGPYIDMNDNGAYDPGEELGVECYWVDDPDMVFTPGPNEGNFAIGQGEGEGFLAHLTGDIAMGVRCGTQIDPGEGYDTVGWVHVEQAAWQDHHYSFSLDQAFVNWNEFSYCLCTDGMPAADADGNIIGLVNHEVPETCLALP